MLSDLLLESPLFAKSFACIRRYILLFFASILATAAAATICSGSSEGPKWSSPDAALWRAIAEDDAEGIIAALQAGAYVDSKQTPPEVIYRLPDEAWGAPPRCR